MFENDLFPQGYLAIDPDIFKYAKTDSDYQEMVSLLLNQRRQNGFLQLAFDPGKILEQEYHAYLNVRRKDQAVQKLADYMFNKHPRDNLAYTLPILASTIPDELLDDLEGINISEVHRALISIVCQDERATAILADPGKRRKNSITYKLRDEICAALHRHNAIVFVSECLDRWPEVWVEGTTDITHLENALLELRHKYPHLMISFVNGGGSSNLTNFLHDQQGKHRMSRPTIIILDRDSDEIYPFLEGTKHSKKFLIKRREAGYQCFGQRLYSMLLPKPVHPEWALYNEYEIEFYYRENEIIQPDEYGKRLFMNIEFDIGSGLHIKGEAIKHTNPAKLNNLHRKKNLSIIEYNERVLCFTSGVLLDSGFVLTKAQFAQHIKQHDDDYCFDATCFEAVFDLINQIIAD